MKKYSLGSLNVVVSFCSNNEARVYLKIMRYFKSTTGICHTTGTITANFPLMGEIPFDWLIVV